MVLLYQDAVHIQWNAQILSEHSLSSDKWIHLCSPKLYQDDDHYDCPRRFPGPHPSQFHSPYRESLLSTGLPSPPPEVSFTSVRGSASNLWPHFICTYLGGIVRVIHSHFQESAWVFGLSLPQGWKAFPPIRIWEYLILPAAWFLYKWRATGLLQSLTKYLSTCKI